MAGRKIGEIYGEIKLKNSQFIAGIDQSKSKLQTFKASSIAIFAGIAAASYGLVKGIGAITKAASDLEEQTAKFKTVFRGSLDVASATVDNLTKSYAMSTREARQNMAAIQDLLVPMGIARSKAAEFSGEIVKLAADLGSFNNLPTAQVMADIESALTGQYRTMRKYGVVLFDTEVRQKALNMGLAATNEELTAGDRALAAYKMMVEGSQDALGDMERTSDSYANTQKRFNASMEDFKAILGDYILPGLTFWVDKLTKIINKTNELMGVYVGDYAKNPIKWEKSYIAQLDKKIQTYKDLMYPIDMINELEDERIWHLQKLNKLLREGWEPQNKLKKEIQETAEAFVFSRKALGPYLYEMDELALSVYKNRKAYRELGYEIRSTKKIWGPTLDEMKGKAEENTESMMGVHNMTEQLGQQLISTALSGINSFNDLGESMGNLVRQIGFAIAKAVILKGILSAMGLGGGFSFFALQKGGYVPAALMSPNLPKISEGYVNRPSILVGEGKGEGETVVPDSRWKDMITVNLSNIVPLENAVVDVMINLPQGKKQQVYRRTIKEASNREEIR